MVLEARTVGSAKDIPIKTLPCRVQKIERVTDDVAILYLKLPANERLQVLAGQYSEFLLKDKTRRSFSMANGPHDDELVQLHVRHVPGGNFTDHVFTKMKERDILRFEGPHGTFFLREDSQNPIVFVASGTGFAPIKSIIEYALNKNIARPMTLYWGGRRPRDLYLNALPLKWAAEHAGFKYVPVVSEALPEDRWTGRTGFVHRAVMEDLPDLSGCQVYACGVPIMVDSARRDFISQCKLPEDEFFADSFTTQADLRLRSSGVRDSADGSRPPILSFSGAGRIPRSATMFRSCARQRPPRMIARSSVLRSLPSRTTSSPCTMTTRCRPWPRRVLDPDPPPAAGAAKRSNTSRSAFAPAWTRPRSDRPSAFAPTG